MLHPFVGLQGNNQLGAAGLPDRRQKRMLR
jgi:hypothetical protein